MNMRLRMVGLAPLLVVGMCWTVKRRQKEGLVKVDRNRCRKKECITIPYSNDNQIVTDGWLVSSSTDVPTKNAKSLTPL